MPPSPPEPPRPAAETFSRELGIALIGVLQEDFDAIRALARRTKLEFIDGEPHAVIISPRPAEERETLTVRIGQIAELMEVESTKCFRAANRLPAKSKARAVWNAQGDTFKLCVIRLQNALRAEPPAAKEVAESGTPAPPSVEESFLRGVVGSTTSYSEGWREVCARLLWAERRIAELTANLATATAQRDRWLSAFNRSEQFQDGPTKRAEAAEQRAEELARQLAECERHLTSLL